MLGFDLLFKCFNFLIGKLLVIPSISIFNIILYLLRDLHFSMYHHHMHIIFGWITINSASLISSVILNDISNKEMIKLTN